MAMIPLEGSPISQDMHAENRICRFLIFKIMNATKIEIDLDLK